MAADTIIPDGFVVEEPKIPKGFEVERSVFASDILQSDWKKEGYRLAGPSGRPIGKPVGPPIGIKESFRREGAFGVLKKLPFSVFGAVESGDLMITAKRLGEDRYETYGDLRAKGEFGLPLTKGDSELTWAAKSTKARDIKRIEDYIFKTQEASERGFTFGAMVTGGVSELPKWMVEFALTGGLSTLGKQGARRAGAKLMGKYAKTKAGQAALRTAGWGVGAAARSFGMPHRIAESVLQRRLAEDPENWATSIAKGWGDVFIEVASEEAGGTITKGLGKLPFAGRFIKRLEKASGKSLTGRIFTKAGYSNLIGEIGEERLATMMHAIANTSDFGAGKNASTLERLKAGIKADIANMPVEAAVLAVPGAVRFGVSKTAQALQRPEKATLRQQEIMTQIKAKHEAIVAEGGIGSKQKAEQVVQEGMLLLAEEEAKETIAAFEKEVEGIEKPPAKEGKVSDIRISKQEEFAGAAKMVLEQPNSTMAKLAFGKEKLVEEKRDFYTYVTPKGALKGKEHKFVLQKWVASDGRVRYVIRAEQKTGELYSGVDAAAQIKLVEGIPEVQTIASAEQKIGLGTALLNQIKKDYGSFTFQEPVSKSGARLLKKVQVLTPEAKPTEGKVRKEIIKAQKQAKPIDKDAVTPPAVQGDLTNKHNLDKITLTSESRDAVNVLDRYWRLKDEADFVADVDEAKNQEAIARALGKRKYNPGGDRQTDMTAQAMMLYIDLKEHPSGHQFVDQLTAEQKYIYEISQKLPPSLQKIADDMALQNKKAGQLLKDEDVIRNVRENYIAHIWEKPPQTFPLFARFSQKTARRLPRTLEGGIMEGWSKGLNLRINDVTEASRIARQQGTQALAGKKLLDMGKDWGLMGHKQLEGWQRIEHPNFTTWRHAGKAEPGEVYGKDLYVNEKGDLFEQVPVYAEPVLAKKLNKILSPSGLLKIPGVETLTFYNDQIKSAILITALFHHQAFLRSQMLGGRKVNTAAVWEKGKQAIFNMEPDLRFLVQNGLTIGKIQDYDPRYLTGRQTIWGRVLSSTELTEKGRKFMVNLRNRQVNFLFNKMGPYLKAGTALIEYNAEMKKNQKKLERGEITHDEIAKSVATLMNNDFGGLHLGRLERGATAQHLFKILALAPDWTESNVRSMVQMLNRGETGRVHRLFWGRVAAKGLGATIALNLMLSGMDDDDFWTRQQKAWETGRLRWLDVDITPIYRSLGGTDDKRKYFSLIGHFRDPVKFVAHPFVSAKHKSSVFGRVMTDLMIGQDWAGRDFTTIGELTGISEKGKLKGRLVKWGRGKARPIEPAQLPSYAAYQVRSAMPIPVQNSIAFLGGEMDAFDAITKSLGLMTATTYPPRKKEKSAFIPRGKYRKP